MNITLANYPSMAPNVNWSKYPSVQKEVYDQNKAGSLDFKYWKEFLEDEEIKAIVAKHISVLNTAQGSAKGKAVIAKATKAKNAKASRTTATKKVTAKRAASKPKVEPKATDKPKFNIGSYVYFKITEDPNVKKVGKILGYEDGVYTVNAKDYDGDFYNFELSGSSFIQTTKATYEATRNEKTKPAPKAKSDPKSKESVRQQLKKGTYPLNLAEWVAKVKKIERPDLSLSKEQYAKVLSLRNNVEFGHSIEQLQYLASLSDNAELMLLTNDLYNSRNTEDFKVAHSLLEPNLKFRVDDEKKQTSPKAKPAPKAKAMAKPKFKVGDYVKSRTQGFIVLVSEVSTINGEYVYKGVNPNYTSNFVEKSLIKSTKQAYDKLYGKVTIAKSAPKAKAIAKPKVVKTKAPAKPKADPKKAIKAEISTLQKKSAITATAMRKINRISVETIRQMKGLAGDREMEALKYERDILKAIVAKDTAKLKRIAKSSNIDANILTDILPKRK